MAILKFGEHYLTGFTPYLLRFAANIRYFAKLIGEDFERRDRDEKRERLRQKFDELVDRIGEEKLNVILANLAMQEVAA